MIVKKFIYQSFYIPMLRRSLRFFIALITDVTVAVIRISIILGHLYDHSKQNYVFFQQHKRKVFIHSFKNFKFTLRLFISALSVPFRLLYQGTKYINMTFSVDFEIGLQTNVTTIYYIKHICLMKQLTSRNEFISYARMTKYTAKNIMNTISKSRNLPYFYCRLQLDILLIFKILITILYIL